MSQSNFGTIDPNTKTGTQLAADLNAWRTAVHSNHSGTARPSYVIAGMIWLDTTANPNILKFYDGADDIPLMSINTSTNVAVPSNIVIPNASVALGMMAVQAANTVLANATNGNASPTAVAIAANKFLARASTGDIAAQSVSDAALTLLAQTTQALMRSAGLGLGTLAIQDANNVNITGGSISGVTGLNAGIVKIEDKGVVSGVSSVDFNTGFDNSLYDCYFVDITNCGGTSGTNLYVYTKDVSSGGAYRTSGYSYNVNHDDGGTITTPRNTSAGQIQLMPGVTYNAGHTGIGGRVNINSAAGRRAMFNWQLGFQSSTNNVRTVGSGACGSAAEINALRFALSTGNISGVFTLYGVKKT